MLTLYKCLCHLHTIRNRNVLLLKWFRQKHMKHIPQKYFKTPRSDSQNRQKCYKANKAIIWDFESTRKTPEMIKAKLNHSAVYLLLQWNHLPSFSIYTMGMPPIFLREEWCCNKWETMWQFELKERHDTSEVLLFLQRSFSQSMSL